jgi:hypothetical protein
MKVTGYKLGQPGAVLRHRFQTGFWLQQYFYQIGTWGSFLVSKAVGM